MHEHKIVVLGTMGAGKSTLVRAIGGGRVVDTDVPNTDASAPGKAATTVAMDYTDVDLPNGDRLRLYGTPGQQRFAFLWPILLQGASGALVLVDATGQDTAQALHTYLQAVRDSAPALPVVVGVTRLDLAPSLDLGALADAAAGNGPPLPLVPVDARSEADALLLLDVLMGEIEAAGLVGSHAA